jgi:23S rRNA pseudouridine2605 synthase
LEITIAEGRNREVRRFCEVLGLQVERLVRVRFGPVVLDRLESGATRLLSGRERRELEHLLGRPVTPARPPRGRQAGERTERSKRDASHGRTPRKRR